MTVEKSGYVVINIFLNFDENYSGFGFKVNVSLFTTKVYIFLWLACKQYNDCVIY